MPGTSPLSASGDYSDVSVSSPYCVIPWPEVSRLNDEEMKPLMIDVVDRTYRFIHTLFDERTGGELLLRLAERDPPQWQPFAPPLTTCLWHSFRMAKRPQSLAATARCGLPDSETTDHNRRPRVGGERLRRGRPAHPRSAPQWRIVTHFDRACEHCAGSMPVGPEEPEVRALLERVAENPRSS